MIGGVLIVGLGQIGMGYDLNTSPEYIYSHARAFSIHPDFYLIGAVEPDLRKREVFVSAYHCPAYPDIDAALAGCQPDVIIIATPTTQHKENLAAALRLSSPKAVLCEKPLSYVPEDGFFMVEMCAAKSIKLYVNYMRRSDPGVVEIKDRIESKQLSSPIKGFAWYSKGFLHNGSHLFNLLEYWLGAMQDAQVINRGRMLSEHDSEPDVHVRFAGGEVTLMSAWEEAFSHYTIELVSPAGRLRYEQGGEIIAWQSCQNDAALGSRSLSETVEIIPSGMNQYQWHVADELSKAMHDAPANLCTGFDAQNTLRDMIGILC